MYLSLADRFKIINIVHHANFVSASLLIKSFCFVNIWGSIKSECWLHMYLQNKEPIFFFPLPSEQKFTFYSMFVNIYTLKEPMRSHQLKNWNLVPKCCLHGGWKESTGWQEGWQVKWTKSEVVIFTTWIICSPYVFCKS